MTNDIHARRIAEAQVIGASLALMTTAGWTIRKDATTELPRDFWNYLYVSEPALLLVPTIEDPRGLRGTVGSAVRQARSDALIIYIGKTTRGERQVSALVSLWSSLGVHWYGPHLPWLSQTGDLWLVPDPRAPVDAEPSFRLAGGPLEPRSKPFANTIDRYRGLTAARVLIDQALEG